MKPTLLSKFTLSIIAALVLASAAFAIDWPAITVQRWGPSEINEDGNLRFRIDGSASGFAVPSDFSFECSGTDLQLWAYIVSGPAATMPAPGGIFQLIKSKDACNSSGSLVRSIMGTSSRFKLSPGTYTYYHVVVLNTGDTLLNPDGSPAATILAVSDPPHVGGTVTLP